ncbi:MAG: hypothetical protein AAF518_03965 [Spirochaetota bacterium]
MSKKFYTNWLQIDCILTILVGLTSFAASRPTGMQPWVLLFDLLAWPLDGNPAGFTRIGFALNAVLGGVMVGWGVTMFLLARWVLPNGNEPVRKGILVGILAWYVVDSTGSFVAGLPGNVVLNTLFLLLFLPPLIGLRQKGRDYR